MKPIHLLLVALGALTLIPVNARSNFVPQMLRQYKLEKDNTATKANCQYCHVQSYGGSSWNAFGLGVRETYLKNKRNIGLALLEQLKKNLDSDNDGYTDMLEAVAKTLPGDPKSKPSKSTIQLESELKRLGGVNRFKP